MWKWTNLLTLDTIFIIVVICLLIYFLITVKKRKHEFIGLDTDLSIEEILRRTAKSTKRKKRYNKSEERCREIFSRLLHGKFKSVRPSWLKNPATGKNLELDGYCPTIRTHLGMGVAFEYDGGQHARYTPHFHRSPKEFIYQTKKDAYKDMKCKERGVLLIRIPHTVIYDDLERYITMKLSKHGL